jgi:hypothetical protein
VKVKTCIYWLFCSCAVHAASLPQVRLSPFTSQGPLLSVNGNEFPASIYYANNQYERDELALEGMRKAYDAGFRVLSIQLLLPGTTSPESILQTLEKFLEPFPEALILPRVWMGVSSDWYKNNPDQLYMFADGTQVPDIATPVSEKWLAEAEARLEDLIDLIAESNYADRFIGMIPLYYYTGEWHMWELGTSGGYSPRMETAFQQWAEKTYGSVANLNNAWNSDLKRFENIRLPTKEERYAGALFRDPKTQQREIDFALFFNTRSPQLMKSIARTIKHKTGGRSLVGYFYGYLFEHAWHNTWPQQSGHLGLSEILACPDIDFFGCSYSYNFFNRKFGLPVDFISPHDSAQLNGKAVFLEEDSYTHMAIPPEMDWAPGWQHRTKNREETLAVLKRNLGVAIAHGEMMHWQDLLSDGRFNDERIWQWYLKAFDFQKSLDLDAPYAPQVAVLIDETYPVRQRVEARAVYGRWVYETRMMLSRVDTTVGWYLQSDLDKLPGSVRCVVLLTPYDFSESEKQALKEKFMRDGKMVVFGYMPDDPSGLTGIHLKWNPQPINPQSRLLPKTLLPDRRKTVFGDNRDLSYIENHPNATLPDVAPHLVIDDPDALVFARYTQTDQASCALRQMDGWKSVVLGSHRLTPHLWRELFRRAGCHLWLDELSNEFNAPDFIQASGNFLMVQSFDGGEKEVFLPESAGSIFLWRDGESTLLATNAAAFDVNLKPGVPEYIWWEKFPRG